ncbi:MAG: GtrA family protein [Clostridiales bacterium]|nr:GtrA family protein [Clostridiales bacterium]
MIEKIKQLFTRYREQIVYLFVGGVTTVIGTGVYWLSVWLGADIITAQIIQWVCAVIWAYWANKKLVFRDGEKRPLYVIRQFLKFAASRLFSLGVETLLIWIGCEKLGIDKYLVKIPVAVIVVVLNYVTGKLMVFVKKKEK